MAVKVDLTPSPHPLPLSAAERVLKNILSHRRGAEKAEES